MVLHLSDNSETEPEDLPCPSRSIRVIKITCVSMIDEGELDWKIVAISLDDPKAHLVNDVDDVEKHFPGTLTAIRDWFRDYKIPDGKPANRFGLGDKPANKDYALKIIHETNESWAKLLHLSDNSETEPEDLPCPSRCVLQIKSEEKMDKIATVKDGFNQVAKRQKHYHSTSQAVTDLAFEGFVESLVQILTKNDLKTVLTELKLKLDSLFYPINQLQESQKEWNTSLTKFEKVLGKPDMFPASSSRSIDLDHQLVDKMLVEYLYRQGLFEVGDCLAKEAGVEVEKELSLEIHRITEPLKQRDIEPAMRWISENSETLKEHGPKLELELVSLKYYEILRQGNSHEALRFAKAHFPKFATLHTGAKIRRLVVALLWVGDLENCPHAEEELFSLSWDKTSKEVARQYYHLHDQPSSSPLAVLLSAGVQSLPKLMKLVRVMGLKKEEWEAMKQLPVDLELGDEFRFHSVFVCPVSREQSDDEDNPPMMMPCRHVLCKQSILRLCKSCSTRRFKCPYCPAQTTAAACRQLYI
ncbi:hypothetical protein Bca52824_005663 [Brassica carinata]|uniref:inorganic diphosphatase n=1 Tax=Brassica carinata TaxID=52824 RepID=A0A8X7WTU0_BRACI|nr:hypothetical protein Bca52824_005663 [Brassica carinata]